MPSILSGLFAGIRGYAAAGVIGAGAAGYLGYDITHKIDAAATLAIKLADAKAQSRAIKDEAAIQESQDRVNLGAALSEARAQQKIVTVTHTITREIPVHVPETRPCIPYGLVRLLDDAATGSDTADAPSPAGQSDDACASISWRDFAGDLTDDYAIGRSNAEQLNALEADVRGLVAAANAKPPNGDDE